MHVESAYTSTYIQTYICTYSFKRVEKISVSGPSCDITSKHSSNSDETDDLGLRAGLPPPPSVVELETLCKVLERDNMGLSISDPLVY